MGTNKGGDEGDMAGLRERAERLAEETRAADTALLLQRSESTVHELRLHQIELELQNQELRATQRELETARQRYRDLYDAAPVGYVTLDARGAMTDVNKTAGTLLRSRCEDLVGELFSRFVAREDQDALYHHRKGLGNSGPPRVTELRMVAQDGEVLWIRLEELATTSAEGFASSRLMLSDVTERKKTEAALLQTERLASIGMLAASVAHEINNPLTYVLMSVESISEALPEIVDTLRRFRKQYPSPPADAELSALVEECEAAAEEARDAVDGVERIDQIARSLGAFGRTQRIARSPVDVNACLERAAQLSQNETRFRATVRKSPGVIPPVLASEGRLCQVFVNLIVNAAQAIEPGDAESNEIHLTTSVEGDAVLVEIRDTGSGIAPENLPHIFKPFFTTKDAGKGSGLGLAILHGILQSLGGSIRIESELSRGTRALVTLPAYRGAPVDERSGSPQPSLIAQVKGGRLLVVDDERAIVSMIERNLRSDHEIVAASSAIAARAILETDQAFDFILCDVIMPDFTGLELHAWLAARNPGLAERMIFMTGGVFMPGPARYLATLKNPLLTKPFSNADIRARLATARDES